MPKELKFRLLTYVVEIEGRMNMSAWAQNVLSRKEASNRTPLSLKISCHGVNKVAWERSKVAHNQLRVISSGTPCTPELKWRYRSQLAPTLYQLRKGDLGPLVRRQ